MPNLLFVHGTGVRQPSYDNTCTVIKARLEKSLPDYDMHRCYWGETEGCRLRSGGASIPDYDTARAVGMVDSEDIVNAQWRLLYEDPESELDAFIGQSGAAKPFNPAAEGPLETITAMVESESKQTLALEQKIGVKNSWLKAKSQLLASVSAAAANRIIPELDGEFRAALARALVANAIDIAFGVPGSSSDWPDGGDRDALVNALRDTWGGMTAASYTVSPVGLVAA